jgi:hypothetical protein
MRLFLKQKKVRPKLRLISKIFISVPNEIKLFTENNFNNLFQIEK